MKKILTLFICLVFVVSLCACSSKGNKMIEEAIVELCDYYKDYCEERYIDNKYLKICNTRLITLKDTITGDNV